MLPAGTRGRQSRATVDDPLEGEPAGGRELARRQPIAGRQDPIDLPGLEPALPHAPPASRPVERTIWCRNAFARNPSIETVALASTVSSLQIAAPSIVPLPGCRQNDAKSCSPSERARRPQRTRGHIQWPGRCHTNRAVNGSATAPCRSGTGTPGPSPRTARRTRRARTDARHRRRPRAPRHRVQRRAIRSGRRRDDVGNETTCPRAWTPASVRPATDERTARSPRHAASSVAAARPRRSGPTGPAAPPTPELGPVVARASRDRHHAGRVASSSRTAGPAATMLVRARPARSAPSARRRPCAARASGSGCSRPDARRTAARSRGTSSATTSRSGMSFSTSRRAARSPFFAFVISFSA